MNIKLFQAQPCRVYSSLAEGLDVYSLANMAQRSFWIDNVKAICMIGVYLLHSEVYYGFGDIQYGILITPFYVNAFFFVSGYLMFNKYLNVSVLGNNLVTPSSL